ncbi:MAG: 23S rRNA (adenine(2503)-C(2))-methyltransferase RlmN [Lachnospiraceae bacterium]|nr:23S rRNA (adenine(2503)-C(2))-methyltransferase RlmN [Lachnospiraceae bacterium]
MTEAAPEERNVRSGIRNAEKRKEEKQDAVNAAVPESESPFQGRIDIKSLELPALKDLLAAFGEKPFRAEQIYEWLHQKKAESFDEMTNLSKPLREKLKESTFIMTLREAAKMESKLDGTCKYLFELYDERVIESVLMRYHHGNSVCISSQVGCRMGCRFCASTLGGLERNLTASEMLEQVYQIERLTGERVSNVVVMGTGEPLDNYENLTAFIRILSSEKGLHISQRNITVSTCGLVEKIERLADEKLTITLALSMHAPNDEVRRQLMPVANKYALKDVLAACDHYYQKTGRRLTFEYSLTHGVNDGTAQAKELASLLKGKNCHVNLIPVNPVRERAFTRPDGKNIQNFKNVLEKNQITVTIRREMGSDIDAACGQLRKRYMDTNKREGGE